MILSVRNEYELAEAMAKNIDHIILCGDLAEKIFKDLNNSIVVRRNQVVNFFISIFQRIVEKLFNKEGLDREILDKMKAEYNLILDIGKIELIKK